MTATLPSDLRDVFARCTVAELVTIDGHGRPVAHAVVPAYRPGGPCIDVAGGAPGGRGSARRAAVRRRWPDGARAGDGAAVEDVLHVRPERVYAWASATRMPSRGCSTRTSRRCAPATTRSPRSATPAPRAARRCGTSASMAWTPRCWPASAPTASRSPPGWASRPIRAAASCGCRGCRGHARSSRGPRACTRRRRPEGPRRPRARARRLEPRPARRAGRLRWASPLR